MNMLLHTEKKMPQSGLGSMQEYASAGYLRHGHVIFYVFDSFTLFFLKRGGRVFFLLHDAWGLNNIFLRGGDFLCGECKIIIVCGVDGKI